ncbi:sodium-coupled monocarboxylate transporter 1-like [Homalodisca vitripennis]|uniref:sodium-coupled monocarboxylate transporter 1-like n=1 Tax=Homalodisca vitripennis TaxID=197043 RepID=UPI001EEBD381|nr:sodium-coupled monocarboxylate transporter 1-like [Homalodisca vitripennis]
MNGTESNSLMSAALMFSWVEYSVFCSMLLLSLLVGVYFGYFKKQDTVAEYLLGGKKMSVFPVAMSLTFSHVSGVSLIGVPAEVYSYGTQYFVMCISFVIMYFIVVNSFLPVFFNLQLNSLYEYLELRFSKGTRTLASLLFALSLVLFIPVVIYIPALAFNQVTGVSIYVITPIVCVICLIYTSFGGLKAVVWTDTLQSAFTISSTLFILVLGFLKIGSISEVFRINGEGHRLELFNMDPSPFARSTFWTISLGSVFTWLSHVGVHPGTSQRFIAVSTVKEARAVLLWTCVGYVWVKAITTLLGMLIYAHYHDCDPIATKMVQKSGQVMPFYVMQVAKDYPGLTGLFISGALSAALSTMSAGLNTVAGTIYEDFVQFILRGKQQSEAMQAFTLKVVVLVIGVICSLLVPIVERLGGLLQVAVSLHGVNSGALVGVFCLGVFFPRANAKGAIVGVLMSVMVMTTIVFGGEYFIANGLLKFPGKVTSVDGCPADFLASLPFNASARVQTYVGVGSPVVADASVPLIFQMSYWYYITLGTLVVLLVGLPVSYLTEPVDMKHLEPALFAPFVRQFLPQKQKFPVNPPAEEYKLVATNDHSKEVTTPESDNKDS